MSWLRCCRDGAGFEAVLLNHGFKSTTYSNRRFGDNEDIVEIMLESGFYPVPSGVQCYHPYCTWNEYDEDEDTLLLHLKSHLLQQHQDMTIDVKFWSIIRIFGERG
jgi:hypothetical protein